MAEIVSFSYSSLAKEVQGKLTWVASEMRKQCESHVKTGLEIGRLLTEARKLLDNETTFRSWVEAECGFAIRSAYNYISAFDNFGACANFARIELSAMYELAKNDLAKKKALKLADKGKTVTYSLAKELCREALEAAPRSERVPRSAAVVVEAEEDQPTSSEEPITVEGTIVEGEEGVRTDAKVTEDQETYHGTPRSGTDAPVVTDFGSCPNCAGTRWTTDDDTGVACSRCHHPHGEPVGDVDDERIKIQRSKTVKTAEALMRAFDDLHLLSPAERERDEAVATCKMLVAKAKAWK